MPYVCRRTDQRDFDRTIKNGEIIQTSKIRCVYNDRGCEKIVQLQHLDQHEDSFGFTPAVCTNPGCGATLNKRDVTVHESELCEYRKLKCHSCGEMTKTLTDMEKRMARMETNKANVEKNMEKKLGNLEKNMETHMKNADTTMNNNTELLDTRMANVETKMAQMKTDIEGKLEAVNNEVKGLKTALVEAFDQMKDILVKMEDKKEENAKERNAPSGDRENIIVAGGSANDSVEMFNWRQRTWLLLPSMPDDRYRATSFVYDNQVVVAGGYRGWSGFVNVRSE